MLKQKKTYRVLFDKFIEMFTDAIGMLVLSIFMFIGVIILAIFEISVFIVRIITLPFRKNSL